MGSGFTLLLQEIIHQWLQFFGIEIFICFEHVGLRPLDTEHLP